MGGRSFWDGDVHAHQPLYSGPPHPRTYPLARHPAAPRCAVQARHGSVVLAGVAITTMIQSVGAGSGNCWAFVETQARGRRE